jgi:hypothetical protein
MYFGDQTGSLEKWLYLLRSYNNFENRMGLNIQSEHEALQMQFIISYRRVKQWKIRGKKFGKSENKSFSFYYPLDIKAFL